MKRMMLLAVLLSTQNAMADSPPADNPPPPAPPPGDVSQINGHPVPVGDHNQYYYSFNRWNVSTNPLGWVLGTYGASASYAFHPNFAARVDANVFEPVGSDDSGYEVGVGVPIYFRRAYQGVFLEPGVMVRRLEREESGSTTAGPQVLVGWHWLWDSGLNVAVALGVGRNWSSNDTDSSYDDEELFVNGYLRFGYAFGR